MSYLDIRQSLQLQVMIRRRYFWDLNCEKSADTTRQNFFNALY